MVENEPELAGITFLPFNQARSSNLWSFKIVKGEEERAVNSLVAALENLTDISLADHSRGDFESMATYERTETGYRVMTGGHGWSSDWVDLDSAEIIAHMHKRVQYNYGRHPSETGRLKQTKRQLE